MGATRRPATGESSRVLPHRADCLASDSHRGLAATHFQYWIRQDSRFDWRTLKEADFEADFDTSQRKFNEVIGTDDPFMTPGVGHCAGGDGPNPVGLFETLVNWVEKGVAPDTLPASRRREDGTVMSRPLCPYPTIAKWNGSGSTDDARNFSCVDGRQEQRDFRVADAPRK